MPFKAIIPKRDPFAGVALVIPRCVAELGKFGLKSQARLQQYPASRARYRRTGNLGRRWTTKGPRVLPNSIKVTIGNNADYGIWVQGPTKGGGKKQVGWAARYGWYSVTTVVEKIWPQHRRNLIRILMGHL